MIGEKDIKLIDRTRELLRQIRSEMSPQGDEPYAEGALAEACRTADDALLNVIVFCRIWFKGKERDAKQSKARAPKP